MKKINKLLIELAQENDLTGYMEPPLHKGKPILHVIFDTNSVPQMPDDMMDGFQRSTRNKFKKIPYNFSKINLEEKMSEFNFLDPDKNSFEITFDNIYILKFFKKLSENKIDISEIKNIYIKNPRGEQPYKNWENITQQIYSYLYEDEKDIVKYVYKNYTSKYSKYELKSILNELGENLTKEEIKEVVDQFCINHKDLIKTIDQNHINGFYMKQGLTSPFSTETQNNIDINIFSENKIPFTQIFINKENLFKKYPITKSLSNVSVAGTKEYLSILNIISSSLNNEKNGAKLGIKNIYINGEQNKNPDFILTVGHSTEFDKKLFQKFLTDSFELFLSIQSADPDSSIYTDKEEFSAQISKIISKVNLEDLLDENTDKKDKNKRKI